MSYKVLWVDDNPEESLKESMFSVADMEDMDITLCPNWDAAEDHLSNREKYVSWDAIILDAFCVMHKGEMPDSYFTLHAKKALAEYQGKYHWQIPDFILSAGTMDGFSFVKGWEEANGKRPEAWGKPVYLKNNADLDEMFANIKKAASESIRNQVKWMYRETFNILEDGTLFLPEASELMVKFLLALHFPQENHSFDVEDQFNSMRKFVEYIFRSANKLGVLPDIFIDQKKDEVILQLSSLYLAGCRADFADSSYIRSDGAVAVIAFDMSHHE